MLAEKSEKLLFSGLYIIIIIIGDINDSARMCQALTSHASYDLLMTISRRKNLSS